MNNKIINGDCIEELKKLPENSVDAIVTDPPYGLEFMGKEWDKFNNENQRFGGGGGAVNDGGKTLFGRLTNKANSVYQYGLTEKRGFQDFTFNWATECLRVLKPGGFLLSFGGTRTYHRMACGIEDAGFEIRDTIMWLYGSGFPKSLNIGKQIDKMPYRVKRNEIKKYLREWVGKSKKSREQIDKECGFSACNYLRIGNDEWGVNLPRQNKWFKMKEVIGFDNKYDEEIRENERIILGRKKSGIGQAFGDGEWKSGVDIVDETKGNSEWEGWGTALKPANEPIVVARKPLSEKNVALNVLKWGTGGINIDGCRVGFEDTKNPATNPLYRHKNNYRKPSDCGQRTGEVIKFTNSLNPPNTQGRFPANIILDEEAGKMLDEQSGEISQGHWAKTKVTGFGDFGNGKSEYKGVGRKDKLKGGASRFFYCPKASKSERNKGCEEFPNKQKCPMSKESRIGECINASKGMERFETICKNNHPTIKPIKLMQYLVRLVTKNGGVVLDPFLGSGTTAIACVKEGMQYIGIEQNKDYCKIAEARLKPFMVQERLI